MKKIILVLSLLCLCCPVFIFAQGSYKQNDNSVALNAEGYISKEQAISIAKKKLIEDAPQLKNIEVQMLSAEFTPDACYGEQREGCNGYWAITFARMGGMSIYIVEGKTGKIVGQPVVRVHHGDPVEQVSPEDVNAQAILNKVLTHPEVKEQSK